MASIATKGLIQPAKKNAHYRVLFLQLCESVRLKIDRKI